MNDPRDPLEGANGSPENGELQHRDQSAWTLRLAGPQDDGDPRMWNLHPGSDGYGVGDLSEAVKRRRLIAMSIFLAIAATAAAWLWGMPRTYEASTRIFVKRERVDPGADSPVQMAIPITQSEVTSEIELLRSRELLRKVIKKYGLIDPNGPGSTEERVELAVRDFEQTLRVTLIPDSSLISVRYASQDPAQAAAIVNTLADLYMDKHATLHKNIEALEFFKQQAERYATELEEFQSDLTAFRERNQISMLGDQKQSNIVHMADLEAGYQGVEAQLRDAQQRLILLKTQAGEMPERVRTASRLAVNEPLVERLKSTLMDFENERTELLSRYEPGYRLVQEMERKIRDTRAALDQAQSKSVVDETQSLNPLRQAVEGDYLHTQAEVAGLRARSDELLTKLRTHQRRQSSLERITAEHDALDRKARMAEQNFMRYQNKEEDARIASALDQERLLNVSIVEKATPPALPINQHLPALVLLSILVASAAAVGGALMVDRYQRPFANISEIATAAGVPVLVMTEEPTTHVS